MSPYTSRSLPHTPSLPAPHMTNGLLCLLAIYCRSWQECDFSASASLHKCSLQNFPSQTNAAFKLACTTPLTLENPLPVASGKSHLDTCSGWGSNWSLLHKDSLEGRGGEGEVAQGEKRWKEMSTNWTNVVCVGGWGAACRIIIVTLPSEDFRPSPPLGPAAAPGVGGLGQRLAVSGVRDLCEVSELDAQQEEQSHGRLQRPSSSSSTHAPRHVPATLKCATQG